MLGVIVVAFLLINFVPSDPALIWAGKPRGPQAAAAIEKAREYLGLNLPLYSRIILHIYRFFSGDWGTSVQFKLPVFSLVARSFMSSLELVIYSFIIALPLALKLGSIAALHRSSIIDKTIYYFSVIIAGTPRFMIAGFLYLLLYLAGYSFLGLRISPSYSTFKSITGFITIDALITGRFDIFVDSFLRILPPALALSTYPLGVLTRVIRVSLSETFEEEYVKQAVSLGISRKIVVRKYAYPNITPVVAQLTGLMFSYLLLEAMVVENVFSREGLGSVIARAIVATDYPLLIGATTFTAILLVIVNTIADVVQAATNPRVQL